MEQKKNKGWRVNFSDKQNKQIADFANCNNMTKSAVVRQAIKEFFEKQSETKK